MALVYLVRHGEPAAPFEEHPDPGLSEVGQRQAIRVAAQLAAEGPMRLVTSPLLRTRETAAALERTWGTRAAVESAFAEIPWKAETRQAGAAWLRESMSRRWPDLPEAIRQWRTDMVDRVVQMDQDTVVFSHFFAINAVVSVANGDDAVVQEMLTHCCTAVLQSDGGSLETVRVSHLGD